jgi:uncharacterized protein (TIGR02145 family)
VADDDATNESVTITQAVKGADYETVISANVTATVTDDDERGVTFSQSLVTVNEPSIFAPTLPYTAAFTVKLNTQPTGNVTITPTSNNPAAARVSTSRTFTTANWNTPQTVTLTGLADNDATNESVAISFNSTGADYQGKTFADVTATVIDSEVMIGTQTWARNNLALVPTFYPNEGVNYWTTSQGGETTYGYYYDSVRARSCPSGWDAPTDAQFMVLLGYLGMSDEDQNKVNSWQGTDQGTQLKVGGDSGFEAMLGGFYFRPPGYSFFNFYGFGSEGFLWTKSTIGGKPIAHMVAGGARTMKRTQENTGVGMNVRCIKY